MISGCLPSHLPFANAFTGISWGRFSQAVVAVMAKLCLLFAAAHALSNPPLMQEHWTIPLPNLRLIVRFVFLSGGHLQFHGRCFYLFRRNHWPCADVSGRILQVSYSLKVAKAASITSNVCLNHFFLPSLHGAHAASDPGSWCPPICASHSALVGTRLIQCMFHWLSKTLPVGF